MEELEASPMIKRSGHLDTWKVEAEEAKKKKWLTNSQGNLLKLKKNL